MSGGISINMCTLDEIVGVNPRVYFKSTILTVRYGGRRVYGLGVFSREKYHLRFALCLSFFFNQDHHLKSSQLELSLHSAGGSDV